MSRRTSSKDTILTAAEQVVLKSGAAHLTLDAVAQEAGVSKGGLLYHFPNKEALLQGMIARRVGQCREERKQAEQRFPKDKAAMLKAIVESALDEDDPSRKINSATLAATANDPRLLAPVKEHNRLLFKELAAFEHFSRASLVVLAVQGLWLMETLQVSPLTSRQRTAIARELLVLAEEAAAAKPPKK